MINTMPERISLMSSFLRDKEPLMYLFLLNANYKKVDKEGFTAGVSLKNGITFYYGDSLLEMPVEQFYFVLVHEAQHIFKQHLHSYSELFSNEDRAEDALLMNIATDAIINNEILGFDFDYFKELSLEKVFIPNAIYVDLLFKQKLNISGIKEEDGLTSLRYYNWLKENNIGAKIFKKGGKVYLRVFNKDRGEKDPNAKKYEIFEDFGENPYGSDSDEGGEEKGNEGDRGGNSFEETKNMLDRLIKQAVKMEEKLAGNSVGSMTKKITEKKEARVNWKTELRKRINYYVSKSVSVPKKKKSYLTYLMNPKSGKDLIFPHYLRQRDNLEANVIVAVDTSGSCFLSEAEMETFFTEIDSIANEMYKSKRGSIHLLQWDFAVQGDVVKYNVGDFKDLKLLGGGGTNPHSIFDYLSEHSTEYDSGKIDIKAGSLDVVAENKKQLPLVVILTDGEFFYNFEQSGIYEGCNNILFFTRSARKIPKHLDHIIYK